MATCCANAAGSRRAECRDEYPQPNPRRHRRDRGHDRPRVHGRSVGGTVGEVIPDEEPVPPRALGGLGDVDEELRISEAGNVRHSDTKSHSTSTRTSARAKAMMPRAGSVLIAPRGFGEAARLSTVSLRYRCRILCRRERDDRGAPLHVQAARKNSPGTGTRGVRQAPPTPHSEHKARRARPARATWSVPGVQAASAAARRYVCSGGT